jgi:outer membrane protein
MKRHLILLLSLLALSVSALAQTALKIGVVNTERLMRDSPLAVTIAKKLEQEFDRRKVELKKQADRVELLQKQIDREGVTMPEAERRIKERELSSLSRDLQRAQREYREDEDVRVNDERRNLLELANRAIRSIAQAEKFDLIIQDPVYVSTSIDLTDRVLKAMGGQ